MSMKKLAVATAVAASFAALSPAFATVAASGNGELLLAVFDDVNKVSYTKDLGLFQNDFKTLGDANDAGYQTNWSLLGDANWTAFLSASSTANLKWTVLAIDTTGGTAKGGVRLFTTAKATADNRDKLSQWSNQQFLNGALDLQTYLDGFNQTGTHGAVGQAPNTAVNGSSVNFDADVGNGYFGNPGSGEFFNGRTNFSNANAVGASSDFFYLTRSGPVQGNKIDIDLFENAYGNSSFTFVANGSDATLSFTTAMAVAAPVPEPSTYAMLLAGLFGLGLVINRRKQR